MISDIPFLGPVASVIVGRNKDGEFILNPTPAELEESDLNLKVAEQKKLLTWLKLVLEKWTKKLC